MKLKFVKEEDGTVGIKLIDTEEVDFDYIKLVNYLYEGNSLEETLFYEGISAEEKEKLEEIINNINQLVSQQE